MPELKASPRNRALGLLADALSGAKSAADTVQLPVVGGLGSLLFGDAPELVNDVAYYGPQALVRGGNAATGGLGTFAPDRRVLDAIGVAPMAPGAVRAAKTVANPMTYRDAFYQAQAPAVMSKIFIGEKAKTWDKAAAEAFKKLEAQGVGNKEAWQQTGTFRSPDGKLRQEIDDKSAFYPRYAMPGGRRYGMFEDVLLHPELQKAYPDITRGTQVGLDIAPESSGKYVPGVAGTKDYYGYSPEIHASGPNRPEIKSTLLHEAQHAIQEVEGFGRGGRPVQFDLSQYGLTVPQVLNAKFLKDRAAETGRSIVEVFREQNPSVFNLSTLQATRRSDLDDLANMTKYAHDPYKGYLRLAGEAEARAVEKRRNLPPEARKYIFPLDSYDVPINELIIKSLLD